MTTNQHIEKQVNISSNRIEDFTDEKPEKSEDNKSNIYDSLILGKSKPAIEASYSKLLKKLVV